MKPRDVISPERARRIAEWIRDAYAVAYGEPMARRYLGAVTSSAASPSKDAAPAPSASAPRKSRLGWSAVLIAMLALAALTRMGGALEIVPAAAVEAVRPKMVDERKPQDPAKSPQNDKKESKPWTLVM